MRDRLCDTRRLGFLTAGLVLVSVACGGSNSAVSNISKTPRPAAVQDCRGATETEPSSPSPGPGVGYFDLTLDRRLRDYRLFTPPGLDLTKPMPLVLLLHGAPIDAQGFENIVHFDQEASTGGFVLASPNGCDGMWNYADGGPKTTDDDFIQRVIEQLEAQFPINKGRVFVVGASAGSWVAYRLACDLADQITAIASVAGTMRLADDCRPSRPVSILEIHGTHDNVHPWGGNGQHHASPVEDVNQRWIGLDGCAPNPAVSNSGITETSVWRQCEGGAVVQLDKVVGGHHTWFGSDFDPVPGEPNANALIWSFFSSVPTR
jgi:polyhydroxybutyrate depolymerase